MTPRSPSQRTLPLTILHTPNRSEAQRTAAAEERAQHARRLNQLRAGVLGANDGIVSIAAMVVGVAGGTSEVTTIALAGIAGIVAGALSMAAGEYVSVSSQRDAEQAMAAAGKDAGTGDAEDDLTNPWHAAVASLVAFAIGGLVPLLVVLAPLDGLRVPATFVSVLVALTATGWASARWGGAPVGRAVLRNLIGGSLAMVITYGIGLLVGVTV